jgi:outer membrane protein assembly factor BamB
MVALAAMSSSLVGCAALSNAGRPPYAGALVAPLWHVGGLSVSDTPFVHDGIVYALGRVASEGAKHIVAVDALSGRRLWKGRPASARILSVGGGRVVAVDALGAMQVFEAKTGRQQTYRRDGIAFAASVDGGLYVVRDGDAVSELGPAGEVAWTRRLPVTPATSPIVAGDVVYAYGTRHVDETTPDVYGVYAIDRATGTLRWRREWIESFGKYRFDPGVGTMRWVEKPEGRVIDVVLADGRAAYISTILRDERGPYATELLAADARTGRTLWSLRSDGPYGRAPNLIGQTEIITCGGSRGPNAHGSICRALSRIDGTERWQGGTPWDYRRSTAHDRLEVVADGRVHEVLTENGDSSPDSWVTLVDRRSGRELWRTDVAPLAVYTSPAVGDGIVAVGSAPFTWNDVRGDRNVEGLWAWPLRLR